MRRDIPGCVLGVAIFDARKEMIFGTNTKVDSMPLGEKAGEYCCEIYYPSVPMLNGEYNVDVGIFDSDGIVKAVYVPYATSIKVVGSFQGLGLVHIDHHWRILPRKEA